MKIAIVGSGISGLGAAYLLNQSHDVTVFEKNDYVGGHSHTVDVIHRGQELAVDTGFIVYNEFNYPHLTALFRHLGVKTEASNMSFAVSTGSGAFEWSGGTFQQIFAQKRNLFSPTFLWMLNDILRFNRVCVEDFRSGATDGLSLGAYLDKRRFSSGFRNGYLLPMGAAIWSMPTQDVLDFPAASFIAFFDNHRLVSTDRHHWRTVTGGSREYVKKLTASFGNSIKKSNAAVSVERHAEGVTVTDAQGHRQQFDQVIMATHSDEALALLAQPTEQERSVLGNIRYEPNRAILHCDPSLMPTRAPVWSSWNYVCQNPDKGVGNNDDAVSITYWMNRLQNIDQDYPLFVSLNPAREPAKDTIFAEFSYDHPQYDEKALRAQKKRDIIQGHNRTWFCGAYWGYGFHEDGLRSGIDVATALGANLPWSQNTQVAADPEFEVAA